MSLAVALSQRPLFRRLPALQGQVPWLPLCRGVTPVHELALLGDSLGIPHERVEDLGRSHPIPGLIPAAPRADHDLLPLLEMPSQHLVDQIRRVLAIGRHAHHATSTGVA